MEQNYLCFAYGSNLDRSQMEERCPSAGFVCVARLKGHALAFTRYSSSRGGGVADVIPTPGEEVWGVVYKISKHDLGRLDRCEGVHKCAYRRLGITVHHQQGRPLNVEIYVANKHGEYKPTTDYKRLIVDGARYWGLPDEYIRALENIETTDPRTQELGNRDAGLSLAAEDGCL